MDDGSSRELSWGLRGCLFHPKTAPLHLCTIRSVPRSSRLLVMEAQHVPAVDGDVSNASAMAIGLAVCSRSKPAEGVLICNYITTACVSIVIHCR